MVNFQLKVINDDLMMVKVTGSMLNDWLNAWL